MQKSDLPFGSEFSPSQVELPVILELVATNEGDPGALEAAILERYFRAHGQAGEESANDYNRRKLANNCKLGLIAYGIIAREDTTFTEFGRSLYSLREIESSLYASLAKHILLNLHGMNLVQCILDMTAAGEDVNLTTLRKGLMERGIHYPPGGKHPSIMRLWLAKAGVFSERGWQIDDARVKSVLGLSSRDFDILANLTIQQRAFVRALANTGMSEPQPANSIRRLAEATYGVEFPEKSLPKQVLNALVDADLITTEKTTDGRGAKPFLVKPTDKLIAELVNPLLDQLANQIDPKLRVLLNKPLDEIRREVESSNRHVAGLALEALAFKLMRLVDLDFLATRLRGAKTGGAEVDLIFESTRLVYTRWQVQCKNTGSVSLEDVAKEVGLTRLLKSNAIVIVSTGKIGADARRFANVVMSDSNLAIIMVDRSDLDRIAVEPSAIVDVFEREARAAMRLKPVIKEN